MEETKEILKEIGEFYEKGNSLKKKLERLAQVIEEKERELRELRHK
ncbi:hypothetical protein [Thermovibrio sp.]